MTLRAVYATKSHPFHHNHCISFNASSIHTSYLWLDNVRNFRQFSTTKNVDQTPQSFKNEYASSPFLQQTGTSIDPQFDPDALIHSEKDLAWVNPLQPAAKPKSRRFGRSSGATKLGKALQETQWETLNAMRTIEYADAQEQPSEDVEQHLDELDELLDGGDLAAEGAAKHKSGEKASKSEKHNTLLTPQRQLRGWKKRLKKVQKYGDNIYDPLDQPIIHKKRVFSVGDKCDGCGALLQNTDAHKIGYVEAVRSNEKQMSIDSNEIEEHESVSELDPDTEMKDIYIPDHQRLVLMDLGLMGKHQKHLTYAQYVAIQAGNKSANKEKKEKVYLERAVCARCHQLEHNKRVQNVKEHTIIPENFSAILSDRLSRKKVNLQQICIIKMVDIFDFHGSFIANLNDIIHADNNNGDGPVHNKDVIKDIPVILALNKIDLLTPTMRKPMNHDMLIAWAWNECKRFRFEPHAIITICARTGYNVPLLLDTAVKAVPIRTSLKRHPNLTTAQRYRDIYIIGTTNVGKSTLLNQLIRKKLIVPKKTQISARKLTTSVIPATTMGVIPFMVKDQINTRLLDTPGVIKSDHLCLKLTDDEYKMLVPKKAVKPVTYCLKRGQSIILGTFGRLDCDAIDIEENLDDEDKAKERKQTAKEPYFYFTVFVPFECSVHVTKIERADEVIKMHRGSILKPVIGPHRFIEDPSLNMQPKKTWSLNGIGLQCAVCDVVFPGVGWIALTGKYKIQFTAHAIMDMKVGLRRPLLPRDMYRNVKKYQGIPFKKW